MSINPKESVDDKARRLVDAGAVRVVEDTGDVITAEIRGDTAVHRIVWDQAGLLCFCKARGRCSHIAALQLVTQGPGKTDASETVIEATEVPAPEAGADESVPSDDLSTAATPSALAAVAEAPVTWRTLQAISRTEFVPASLRGRPEAVLAAVLYGRELGLGPLEALTHVDVVDGRPSPSAELLTRLIRSNGHRLEILRLDDEGATVRGTRADTGEELEVTFTVADAARVTTRERGDVISLAETKRWREYPADMCWARVVTRLYRRLFADVTTTGRETSP